MVHQVSESPTRAASQVNIVRNQYQSRPLKGCHSLCVVEKLSKIRLGRGLIENIYPGIRWRISDSAVCIIDEVRLTWSNSKADVKKSYRWKDSEVHGLGVHAVYTHRTGTL